MERLCPKRGPIGIPVQNLKFLLLKGAKNRMSTGIRRLAAIKSSKLERAEIVMQRLALLLETCENLAYISGTKKGTVLFYV